MCATAGHWFFTGFSCIVQRSVHEYRDRVCTGGEPRFDEVVRKQGSCVLTPHSCPSSRPDPVHSCLQEVPGISGSQVHVDFQAAADDSQGFLWLKGGKSWEGPWEFLAEGNPQKSNGILHPPCEMWLVWASSPHSSCPLWLLSRLPVQGHIFQEVMTQIIFINTAHPHLSSIFVSEPPKSTDTQCSFNFRQFPFLLRNRWLVKGTGAVLEVDSEKGSSRSFPGLGLLRARWKEETITENLLVTPRASIKSPSTLEFFDFQVQLQIPLFPVHELFLKPDLT